MATTRALSIEEGNLGTATVAATRNKEYLDIDLSFSVKPTSGEIYKKQNANAVKQAVKSLLMTNLNEKPFDPYFGADLNNILFELADFGSERDIEEAIRNALITYEPRVDRKSLRIDAKVQPDYNSVDVTVVFTVVNTDEIVEITTVLNRLR
jgi:phage baseplate assembly protein W